VYLIYGTFEVT